MYELERLKIYFPELRSEVYSNFYCLQGCFLNLFFLLAEILMFK